MNKEFQGIICLLFLMIANLAYAVPICSPWNCFKQGAFAEVGVLDNPGPHVVCVGDSPPAPNIQGTDLKPGKLKRFCKECFFNDAASPVQPPVCFSYPEFRSDSCEVEYNFDPSIPASYEQYGTYIHDVSVRGNCNVCPTLGPEEIGSFLVTVPKCCASGCTDCSEEAVSAKGITGYCDGNTVTFKVRPGNHRSVQFTCSDIAAKQAAIKAFLLSLGKKASVPKCSGWCFGDCKCTLTGLESSGTGELKLYLHPKNYKPDDKCYYQIYSTRSWSFTFESVCNCI